MAARQEDDWVEVKKDGEGSWHFLKLVLISLLILILIGAVVTIVIHL